MKALFCLTFETLADVMVQVSPYFNNPALTINGLRLLLQLSP